MGNNHTEKKIISNDFRTPCTLTSVYSKEKNPHITLVSSFTCNINNVGTVILKQVFFML